MKTPNKKFDKDLSNCSKLRDHGELQSALKCVIALGNASKANEKPFLKALILKGAIYADQGRSNDALSTFEKAFEIADSKALLKEKADILRQQSYLLLQMGKANEAESLAFESLDLARQLGLKREEADAIACIGHVFESKTDYQKALSWYLEGVFICDDTDFMERKATLLGDIGKVYGIIGSLPESISFLNRALELSTSLKYQKAVLSSLYRLGDIYRLIGDKAKANELYNQAFEESKNNGYKREQGDSLYRLGLLEISKKRSDPALEFLSKALKIFEKIGYLRQRIYCLLSIGNALEQDSKIDQALENYLNALKIIPNVGEYIEPYVATVENVITCFRKLGFLSEANGLTNIVNQLKDYTKLGGVFDDFRKKERIGELVVTISNMMRKVEETKSNIYRHNDVLINFNKRIAKKHSREIELTKDQWKIIEALWKSENQICSRAELRTAIGWSPDIPTRTIDEQVYKIRKRIGDEFIQSVRGKGYKLLTD